MERNYIHVDEVHDEKGAAETLIIRFVSIPFCSLDSLTMLNAASAQRL